MLCNGIISPPYPEVTLDTFGFLEGGHSVGGRFVGCFMATIAQSGPFGVTKKTTFLCWLHCRASAWGASRVHFWPQNLIFTRFAHIYIAEPPFCAQTDQTNYLARLIIWLIYLAQSAKSFFWTHHPKVLLSSWPDNLFCVDNVPWPTTGQASFLVLLLLC